jgi:hypothetical protein
MEEAAGLVLRSFPVLSNYACLREKVRYCFFSKKLPETKNFGKSKISGSFLEIKNCACARVCVCSVLLTLKTLSQLESV